MDLYEFMRGYRAAQQDDSDYNHEYEGTDYISVTRRNNRKYSKQDYDKIWDEDDRDGFVDYTYEY